MISVAAGMALCGLRPFVYTIVPFVTARCLEQIRVDVSYHRQPVTIVGVGGGLSYASLGGTHHACEDIAMLRVLPDVAVVCPGDAVEVRGAVRAALAADGPVYLRLGKKNEPIVHEQEPDFEIGRSITVRSGDDVALLAVGNLLPLACEVAERLEASGISVRVESFHTVKPLDQTCLADVFEHCRLVATIEEHSRLGGAGGAVAEWLSAAASGFERRARHVSIATPDAFLHEVGSQAFARRRAGLAAEEIQGRLQAELNGCRARGER